MSSTGIPVDCQHMRTCVNSYEGIPPCIRNGVCCWPPATRVIQPSYSVLTEVLARQSLLHNHLDTGLPDGRVTRRIR